MANKRDLKRAINGICGEIFAECAALLFYSDEINAQNAEALLSSVLCINNHFIARISHPEPGMPQKVYYKDLIEQFNKQILELVDQINNLG